MAAPVKNILVAAVSQECAAYESQAIFVMKNKPALEQLCHLHGLILKTRREMFERLADVESRIRTVQDRERALTVLRDECHVLLKQINKGLLELGKPFLSYR